jgi:hypothetical protein
MMKITIDKIEKKMKKLNSGTSSIYDPSVEAGNAIKDNIFRVGRIMNVDVETVDRIVLRDVYKIDVEQELSEFDYRG